MVQAVNNQQGSLFFSKINPFATAINTAKNTEKTVNDVHVEVGSSNIFVDGIRNILSIPTKLLMCTLSVNSGNVSAETIEKMKEYLHENGLHDVHVFVNQYKPQDVWKRTFTNPKTSLLSKVFLGIPTSLMETFTFTKLTGYPGDYYNPLSNTVHLFSNNTAIALHECGHAKDFNSRENPGLYNTIRLLPYVGSIVTLYQEFLATNNAMSYLREKKWDTLLANSFKVLIPAYAIYCSEAVLPKLDNVEYMIIRISCSQGGSQSNACQKAQQPLKTYLLGSAGFLLAGHLVGRVLAANVKKAGPLRSLLKKNLNNSLKKCFLQFVNPESQYQLNHRRLFGDRMFYLKKD